METLHDEFMPLIARPFSNNSSYKEILPDETLRPFIRCFWTEDYSKKKDEHKFCNLIIPDVCMDIITAFDKKNEICFSAFCTVDKKSYYLSDDIVNSNSYFLNRLQTARIDFELMRVCSDMVRSRGIFNMKEAACSVQKSERQLEKHRSSK